MEIDLGKPVEIKVKIGDQAIMLREPTLNDMEIMAEVSKEDLRESNAALCKFLIELGMPEETLSKLGFIRIQKLVKGLTETFSEKK